MKGSSARPGESAAAANPAGKSSVSARGATAPAFDVNVSATELALAELQRLLAAWLVHEPGARLGHDPEALHQLRVTARRIDATLGLFKRHLPASLAQARKTAKSVLRTLGAARDLDVQLAELGRYCLSLSEAERTAAEPLQTRLESELTRARARMVRALDSEPTRRWLETLTLACMQGASAPGAPSERAVLVMPERVRRRFRKLRRSVRRLHGESSMDDYHLVRRRAKQLRYAIESGAAMFGRPAEETLKSLRRLQDKLGAHQDAYIAGNRLSALAADPSSNLPPATLFLMGRLAEHHSSGTAAAHKTLTQAWRKVRGRRWRALRGRLGELAESARQANAVLELHPLPAAAASDVTSVSQDPAPTALHPIKH